MKLKDFVDFVKRNSNLDESEIADRLGLSRVNFSNMKNGKWLPSARVLYLIDRHTLGMVDIREMIREYFERAIRKEMAALNNMEESEEEKHFIDEPTQEIHQTEEQEAQ
jgi:transcriptional regulator with XRE-family HTH domain